MIRQLTIERSMLIILFVLLFTLATRIPGDTDTWWHIRSGEYTLTQGMIYSDPFSFSVNGRTWINHSWGSQIILYGVWQLAGNVGLALYTAIVAATGMAFIYRMCVGSAYLRAFALILGAATAAVFWSARPHMLSFLFSTIVLYLLHLHKRDKRDYLWLVPLIMAIWGNLHAGFSIGFILLFGSIAGEILGNIFSRGSANVLPLLVVRKLVIITLVSILAVMINPYTVRILAVPFETVSIGALQNLIQEWNSPNFHERQTWSFIILLCAVLGAVGASRKRITWTDFILLSGIAFLALYAGRNIATFAVVATPVLTLHLDDILSERGWVLNPVRRVSPMMARLNAALVGIVIVGALVVIANNLSPKSIREAQEQVLPVRAAEFLNSAQPAGPMFNSYNWGGYLMFATPQYPIFIDGRTDLYGDEFINRWFQTAIGADGWQELLDEYAINLVVVENGSGLARQLASDAAWRLIYPPPDSDDEQAVIYARESSP